LAKIPIEVCKTVYTSSILVVASNSTLLTSQRFLIRGGFRQNRAAGLARLISRDRFSIPGRWRITAWIAVPAIVRWCRR
jgi:hypothetical protein